MTTKVLGYCLAIACAIILALSIKIVNMDYYPSRPAAVPSYCQTFKALEEFKEKHPTMIITCDNEVENP